MLTFSEFYCFFDLMTCSIWRRKLLVSLMMVLFSTSGNLERSLGLEVVLYVCLFAVCDIMCAAGCRCDWITVVTQSEWGWTWKHFGRVFSGLKIWVLMISKKGKIGWIKNRKLVLFIYFIWSFSRLGCGENIVEYFDNFYDFEDINDWLMS